MGDTRGISDLQQTALLVERFNAGRFCTDIAINIIREFMSGGFFGGAVLPYGIWVVPEKISEGKMTMEFFRIHGADIEVMLLKIGLIIVFKSLTPRDS